MCVSKWCDAQGVGGAITIGKHGPEVLALVEHSSIEADSHGKCLNFDHARGWLGGCEIWAVVRHPPHALVGAACI